MEQASGNTTFRIRPDIFVKAASGRLYVRHGDSHFILRLADEMADSVLRFLDVIDGRTPLKQALLSFPEQHHRLLRNVLEALVDRGAAFESDVDRISALGDAFADTLTYLAEYSSDPVSALERFLDQRILLEAGGYAALAFVRTLARLGVRRLWLRAPTWEAHGISPKDVRKAFEELACAPDARLTVLDHPTRGEPVEFDHVVTLIDSLESGIKAGRPNLKPWHAWINGEQLIVSHESGPVRAGHHLAPARPLSSIPASRQLLAGAALGLAVFDDITCVRGSEPGSYRYYDLSAHGRMRVAPLVGVVPFVPSADLGEAGQPVDLRARIENVAGDPLHPLEPPIEHSCARSYVKLMSARVRTQDHAVRLVAAGFNDIDCRARLLASLFTMHGLWFDDATESEIEGLSAAWNPRIAAHRLTDVEVSAGTAEMQVGAREDYIRFCITSTYGAAVRVVDVGGEQGPFAGVLVACTEQYKAIMPYRQPPGEQDREGLLFALYAMLWEAENGAPAGPAIVLPGDVLPTSHTTA